MFLKTVCRAVGGGADTEVWLPNWFLIWSIKEARSQLLAEGTGGTSGSLEEKERHKGGGQVCRALEREELSSHVRTWEEQ